MDDVLTPRLLHWLEEPATDKGIHFAAEGGEWDFQSYSARAERIRRVAAGLSQIGMRPGDVVAMVFYGGPEFVDTFIGILAFGGVPCALPPPLMFRDGELYRRHVAQLLEVVDPALVLCETALAEVVRVAVPEQRRLIPACALLDAEPADVNVGRRENHTALLQFTSGSSGTPRVVRLGWGQLEANLAGIQDVVRIRAGQDTAASWLPIYHDMGLVGCLLTPLVAQADIWLLRPDQFIRDPLRWLECFGRGPATQTAAPNFAFSYILKRVSEDQLDGTDFSRWRTCIVGAERIDPSVLSRFTTLLRPHGFDARAFLPAYGLAEATLAVTAHRPARPPHAIRIDWDNVAFGAPVHVLEHADVAATDHVESGDWLVACGSPLAHTDVVVVGTDLRPLSEGHLGEVTVSGAAVGEIGDADPYRPGAHLVGNVLHTGDAGFVHEGQLYVLGRMGDALKVRGRPVFAEQLEAAVQTSSGLPAGRCVVVPGPTPDADAVVIVEGVEGIDTAWRDAATQILRAHLGQASSIQIREVPKGTIPRTSSGKPRRRMLWLSLLEEQQPVLAGD